jgi:hypothetical protein
MYIKLLPLLLESRISDFKDKYANLPVWMQHLLIDGDFTPNKKYLDWLGKIVTAADKIESEAFANDLLERIEVHFNKLSNIDINKFKTYEEFVKATDDASKNLSKRERLAADTELIYEDDRFLIVGPRSQDAVGNFAAGKTNWCISSSEDYWQDYYSENTVILIHDRESEKPMARLALLSPSGANSRDWTLYNSQDHTMSRPGEYLSEILPEEAMEKLTEYLDDDESNISDRQQEVEEKKNEEWVKDNGDEFVPKLSTLIAEHYNILDDGRIEDDLEEYLGTEDYDALGKDLAWWCISYHGRDNGIFLSEDLTKFLKSYEGDYLDQITNAITHVVNIKTYGKPMSNIVRGVLDDSSYENLVRLSDFNLESVLGNAMKKYQAYRNSSNQTYMFADPQTQEKFIPKDINDIVEMLTFGGAEEVANYIRLRSKQKIREHRIKLKNLIRKWKT